VLAHPTYPSSAPFISDVKAAARTLGLRIEVFNASTESEIDAAFAALSARRLGALLLAGHPLFTTRREPIIALAARYAVPTMYTNREFASAGGLITYGPDLTEVYRLTGGYAGRILKGEKAADLPALLPTKFEMIINLRTAKALGLEVPDRLLALADEVIE
jgi:putative ABC transport system substrate-binding protein